MARKDLIVVIAGDNSDLRKKLDQVKRDFSQLGKDLTNIGAKLTAAVTIPLLAVGGAALKLAGDYEQAQIAFETMLGSAEKAKAFLKELEDFAKKTPFDFPGLVDASRRLIAMGFEAERVIPILTAVGDAAAATGTGSVGVDRITKALSQMAAKGKVSAEEMTQQLGELIPAWQMLADEIGVSVPEAMKMAEQGMLDGAAAVDALVRQMAIAYGGTMEKQMTTLIGLFDRAKDTLLIALRDIGVALTPLAKQIFESVFLPMLSGIEKAVAAFAKLPVSIQTGVAALAVLAAATGPVLFAIGQISLGIVALMSLKGPLLTLFTATIPAGVAAITNFGRALVLLSGSYIVPLIASLASLRAGFLAFAAALASGNIAGAIAIAQGAFVGFATTIGAVLLPALALAASAFAAWNIGKWAADNIPPLRALGDAFASFVVKLQQFTGTGAWGLAADAARELEFQVKSLAKELEAKGVVVERGTMSLIQWRDAMWDAAKSSGVAAVATNDVAKAMALLDTLSKNAGDTAKAAIDKLTEAFKAGKITQDEYNKYLAKYKSLTEAAVKPTKELKKTIDQLIAAGELGVSTLDALSITMLAFESATEAGKEAWKALSAELTEGNRTLKEQKQALDEAVQGWYKINPELAAAVAKMNPLKSGLAGVNVEALKVADAGKKVSDAFQVDLARVKELELTISEIKKKLDDVALTEQERILLQNQLNAATNEYNGLLGIQLKTNEELKTMWGQIEGAVRSFGAAMSDALIRGADLGRAFITMLQDIATAIVDYVIQRGITLLKESILEAVAATDLLAAGWKKFFGIVGVNPGGSDTPSVPGAPGGGGGLGGLTGVISMITGIAQLVTSIFQSFQFAAMNKTLDLIEGEVRESKIHLGFILEAMHTYLAADEWNRHEFFKESWGKLLEKMDSLIDAVKAITINVNVAAGAPAPTGPPVAVAPTLVDWAEETKGYFMGELNRLGEFIWGPLNLIRERLDIIDLNVYRQWLIPELEKMSSILTGIYLQLATMGAGEPVGEWIPNATFTGPATAGSGLTVNLYGPMRKGELLENFSRELEAFGISH